MAILRVADTLRGGDQGFPNYSTWLLATFMEPKEIPSCLIPCLLVVFNQQLEILVTAPFTYVL